MKFPFRKSQPDRLTPTAPTPEFEHAVKAPSGQQRVHVVATGRIARQRFWNRPCREWLYEDDATDAPGDEINDWLRANRDRIERAKLLKVWRDDMPTIPGPNA